MYKGCKLLRKPARYLVVDEVDSPAEEVEPPEEDLFGQALRQDVIREQDLLFLQSKQLPGQEIPVQFVDLFIFQETSSHRPQDVGLEGYANA